MTFKLVIEGIDGQDPLVKPIERYYSDEQEAIQAEKIYREEGLIAFLVTPVTYMEVK